MEGIVLVVILIPSMVFAVALLFLFLQLCRSVRYRRNRPVLQPAAAINGSPTHQKVFCDVGKQREQAATGDQMPVRAKAAAFYAHGVLRSAPADFLLAADTRKEDGFTLEARGKNSPHHIGLLSPAASVGSKDGSCVGRGGNEHFVCISNPMYRGNSGEWGGGDGYGGGDDEGGGVITQVETPDTSPSQVRTGDLKDGGYYSPPLTPRGTARLSSSNG